MNQSHSHLLIHFLGPLRPLFAFFLLLMIPKSLLLHSLGLPWHVYLLWSHFVILWARGPLFMPFGFQWVLLYYFFFLHPFLYCWASFVIEPFCYKDLRFSCMTFSKKGKKRFSSIYINLKKKKRISKMYKTMLASIWTVYLDC